MKIFLVALSILLSGSSFATTTWMRCDSCDASSAQGHSSASGYLGAVVVYNLPAGAAFRFFNEMQVVGGPECHPNSTVPSISKNQNRTVGCHSALIAIPEEIQSSDMPLKNALVNFYNATEGSLQAKATFPSESALPGAAPVTGLNGGSAYDFQHNAIYRAELITAARALSNSLQTIASWRNLTDIISTAVGTQLLGMDGSKLKVTITYSDGSKTIIVFDKDMDVASTSSTTAEGLDIVTLDTLNQFINRQINFNNERSLQSFFDTLNFLNVPVTSTYYQLPMTGSCRPIPNGVSCTRPH